MKALVLMFAALLGTGGAAPLTPAQQAAAKAAEQRAMSSLPAGLPRIVGGPAKTVTVNGKSYVAYGEFSAQTLNQISGYAAAQGAAPPVVGTTMSEAVTVIINEKTRVSALTGPLPRELLTALSRAALVVPVSLVTGSPPAQPLARVKVLVLPGVPPTSLIAVSEYVVMLQGGAVRVVRSAAFAASIHQQAAQLLTRAAAPR